MNTTTMIILAVCILGGIALIYIFSYFSDKRAMVSPPAVQSANTATLPLQLQAYERLVLLVDRIAIPNLITRVSQPELSARELQQLLGMSIRQEFEHNITQQIYVSREAWEAVSNLKEQNLLIVNQVASFLPQEARAGELNKALVEVMMQNPDASLHNIVSEALQFEAKKLLQ